MEYSVKLRETMRKIKINNFNFTFFLMEYSVKLRETMRKPKINNFKFYFFSSWNPEIKMILGHKMEL